MHRLLEKLQARLELRRLEDKYVKRKDRIAYVSHATYVDGEYKYPESPSSKHSFSTTTSSASHSSKRSSRAWKYTSAIPSAGNWKR